jgi:hypothetical protein
MLVTLDTDFEELDLDGTSDNDGNHFLSNSLLILLYYLRAIFVYFDLFLVIYVDCKWRL